MANAADDIGRERFADDAADVVGLEDFGGEGSCEFVGEEVEETLR